MATKQYLLENAVWNLNEKRKEKEHDTDVCINKERKGDFRFASFVSATVKMIFCAETEC